MWIPWKGKEKENSESKEFTCWQNQATHGLIQYHEITSPNKMQWISKLHFYNAYPKTISYPCFHPLRPFGTIQSTSSKSSINQKLFHGTIIHQLAAASIHNECPFIVISSWWGKWFQIHTKITRKLLNLIPGFTCCRQSALKIWIVSLDRAQCNDMTSLAASKSLSVSILRAAGGNLKEDRLTILLPCM